MSENTNTPLYFFKVIAVMGNQGKKLSAERVAVSNVETDLILKAQGIPHRIKVPDLEEEISVSLDIDVCVSYVGTLVSEIRYSMTRETGELYLEGNSHSQIFTLQQEKNIQAAVDGFIQKLPAKKRRELKGQA